MSATDVLITAGTPPVCGAVPTVQQHRGSRPHDGLEGVNERFHQHALALEPHLFALAPLTKIHEQVRVARRCLGHDKAIDVVAVLFWSAISGEQMLEALYERLQPCAVPFMTFCERDRHP